MRSALSRFILSCGALLILFSAESQCSYTCSEYIVSPYTYSMYPAAGQTISLLDDEVSTTYPIGFVFDFYCQSYNQVRIASNGFITFDFGNINHAMTPYCQKVPDTTSPNAVIAWNWNDLDPSTATGAGVISYTTIGTSPNQKFIVTYSAVPLWTISSPPPSNLVNTGQIILHETTNLIEIQIQQAYNNGWLFATEGIEDHNGTNGEAVTLPPRNFTLWTATNSAHLFSPFSIASTVTATGPSTICEGSAGIFSASATPSPVSYNWFFPNGWTGASTQPTISAIAGASGNVSVSANYSCGASVPAVLQLTVIPRPAVQVSSVSASQVCSGSPVTIFAHGAHSYTLAPGSITGGTALTTPVMAPTVFSLTGTSQEGCQSNNTATVEIFTKPSPTISVNTGTVCVGNGFELKSEGAFSYNYPNANPVVTPQPAGVHQYTIVGTAANGCTSAPVVTQVTAVALPVLMATADPTAICRGDVVNLEVSGATSYYWYHNQDSVFLTTAKPFSSRTYTVKGVASNNCFSQTTVQVVVDPCTGTRISSEKFTLYPNPFSDQLKIESEENLQMIIYNLDGRMLKSWEVTPGFHVIEPMVSPGTYILQIGTTGQNLRKIIVAR